MPHGNMPAQAPSKLFANSVPANLINPGVYLMHVAQEVIRQAEEKQILPEKIYEAVKLCEITLPDELDKRLVFENYVESDGTVPSLGRHEEELFHDGKRHKEQTLFIVSFPPDRVDPESVYKTTLG